MCLALSSAVTVVGLVRALTASRPPAVPVTVLAVLVPVAFVALLIPFAFVVTRTTGRGDALVRGLTDLRDADEPARRPPWVQDGAPGLPMKAAFNGFDALYAFDPDFSLRLPDVPGEVFRPRGRGASGSSSSGGTGCGGGGGGCGGGCGGCGG